MQPPLSRFWRAFVRSSRRIVSSRLPRRPRGRRRCTASRAGRARRRAGGRRGSAQRAAAVGCGACSLAVLLGVLSVGAEVAFAASSVGDEPEDRCCPRRRCTRFCATLRRLGVCECLHGLCSRLRPGFASLGGICGHSPAFRLQLVQRAWPAGSGPPQSGQARTGARWVMPSASPRSRE